MPRQSISLTEPNAEWVKARIDSKAYTSMSDAVNDLIRQARRQEDQKIEKIRAMLIKAEESLEEHGYSQKNPKRYMGRRQTEAHGPTWPGLS